MFIESSLPRKQGDTANFFSETVNPSKFKSADNRFCLAFWYHMLGSGIGKYPMIKSAILRFPEYLRVCEVDS